jgi:hypothetical protein
VRHHQNIQTLFFGAGVENERRLSHGLRCRLHFRDLERRRGGIRVDEKGDRAPMTTNRRKQKRKNRVEGCFGKVLRYSYSNLWSRKTMIMKPSSINEIWALRKIAPCPDLCESDA